MIGRDVRRDENITVRASTSSSTTNSAHFQSQEVRYAEFTSGSQVHSKKLEMKWNIEEFQRRQVGVSCESKNSRIAKFYAGKYVFLTGGTGFLGKLTMEKLLRACPDLGGIFLLARSKKGKDMHCRLDDVFNEVIFENLSKLQPKFRDKITVINGDMMLPSLGLSIEDRQLITAKVNVIFHGAATVRFDEKLDVAVAINVKGTRDMLALAKECDVLESFVHVSTAFSNCVVKKVDEELSTRHIDPDKIIAICEATPEDILNKMTPDLLGSYPNTYAFTKALGENVVAQYASGLPVCVFRPAVVISTYKEPTPCWIDNIYGPTGVVVGTGIGLLRALQCNGRRLADIVPADMVVNSMIAASHKNAVEKKSDDVPFYNYVSSAQNPITWNEFMEMCHRNGVETPTMKSVWYLSLMLIQNRFLYMTYAFLVHTVPALLVDMVLILIGRKAQMLKVYKKIHKFNDVLTFFMQREWKFSNENVQNLWSDLSIEDQRLFPFDMRALDWEDYFTYFTLGVRLHLIKDDISTLPAAKIRFKRLKLLHRALQALLIIVGLKLLYEILAYFVL